LTFKTILCPVYKLRISFFCRASACCNSSHSHTAGAVGLNCTLCTRLNWNCFAMTHWLVVQE